MVEDNTETMPTPAPATPIRRPRRRGVVWAAAGLIAAMAVSGWLVFRNRPAGPRPSLESMVKDDMAERMKGQGLGESLARMLTRFVGGPEAVLAQAQRQGITPLHYAASVGELTILEEALRQGLKVDAADGIGQRPLHCAAGNKAALPALQRLLQAGADANAVDVQGRTPLMVALATKNADAVKALLAARADANRAANDGTTPLQMSLRCDPDQTPGLLRAGADPRRPQGPGQPLLVLALRMADDSVFPVLLAGGADVNARMPDGDAAMHVAAAHEKEEFIRALLQAGAKPDEPGKDGQTPLHRAAYAGNARLVAILLRARADVRRADARGQTAMHHGAGDTATLAALAAAGGDPAARDHLGRTPMHEAVLQRSSEGVRALATMKVDVNALDKEGFSPLALSVEAAGPATRQALREAGAREDSWTPLHVAAVDADAAAVRKALAGGAAVNARDRLGQTALLLACRRAKPDLECVRALLAGKADPNLADARNTAPIRVACLENNEAMLEALVSAGADVNRKGPLGDAPLHLAAHAQQRAIVRRLLDAGASVAARNDLGQTPLHLVNADSRVCVNDIVEALLDRGADPAATDSAGTPAAGTLNYLGERFADAVGKARFRASEAQFERLLAQARKGRYDAETTPVGLLRRAGQALLADDRAAFLACFAGSDEEIALIEEILRASHAALALRKSMIAAYGPDSWYVFRGPKGVRFEMPMLMAAAANEQALSIEGRRATFTPEEDSLSPPWTLQADAKGRWRIEAGSLVRGMGPPGDTRETMKKLTGLVEELTAKVGHPGVTPESLQNEAMSFFFKTW